MPKICYGTHRTTYLIGSLAIKRPVFKTYKMFLHGLLANLQEATFSKTKWPELCPVLFSLPLGLLVVMERAEPLTTDEYINLVRNFKEFVDKKDYIVPVENKIDSFGKIDGKIVAVDYG
jgi:hypothetical protein